MIGLPANEDAAATGYVKNPKAVENALKRLKASGNEIKGLMTWSVNWDAGKSATGLNYNNSFRQHLCSNAFWGHCGQEIRSTNQHFQ